MKKKKIVLIIVGLILLIGVGLGGMYFLKKKQTYTYEWVEEKDSSIGQYRLYINNSRGKHIDGTARLVFINGKTKKVEIDKEGTLYVKNVVADVRNPMKR